jgi:hypothetical protein
MKKSAMRSPTIWAVANSLTLLAALGTQASADDGYTLATSKTHKLSVVAQGGNAWCSQKLQLKMILDADSPDIKNPAAQIDIMNRLKTPISSDCKTAQSAELTVFEQGVATGRYKANDQSGWQFASAGPIVAEAKPPRDLDTPATGSAAPVQTVQAPIQQTSQLAGPPPLQSPVDSAPASGTVLPKIFGYPAALLKYVREKPSLMQDEGVLREWALIRFGQEYNQVANQEFKLRPLLDRAKADISTTLAQSDPDHVTILFDVQFGQYDFQNQLFPISMAMESLQVNKPCCANSQNAPNMITFKVSDLSSITGLPMKADDAQAFVQHRTQWNSVNRSLVVAAVIKVDPSGFQLDAWGNVTTSGNLEAAAIISDVRSMQVLSWLSHETIGQMRIAKAAEKAAAEKAEAERQAEIHRQQLMAQRAVFIQGLSNQPPGVKLANFMSDGQVNYFQHLDNLRAVRTAALVQSRPVKVTMLVQADGSGRDKVATSWPGKLDVSSTGDQPAFSSGGWYLVSGMLSGTCQ